MIGLDLIKAFLSRYAGWFKLGVIGALLAYGAVKLHERDESFLHQGQAQTQAKWDADKKRQAQLVADQLKANSLLASQNRARDQEIIRDLSNKLDAATADRDLIYTRLRAATSAGPACPGAVPAGGVRPPDLPAATNAGDATLDGLLADALAECQSNAARQNAMMDSLGLR